MSQDVINLSLGASPSQVEILRPEVKRCKVREGVARHLSVEIVHQALQRSRRADMVEKPLVVVRYEPADEAVQLADDLAVAWMVLARAIHFDSMALVHRHAQVRYAALH